MINKFLSPVLLFLLVFAANVNSIFAQTKNSLTADALGDSKAKQITTVADNDVEQIKGQDLSTADKMKVVCNHYSRDGKREEHQIWRFTISTRFVAGRAA